MEKLLGFLMLSLAATVSFAEDAYIESSGTNCVPINCYTTPKTKYVIDFAYIGDAKGTTLFGCLSGSGPRVSLRVNDNDSFEVSCYGSYTGRIIARDNERHTAILDVPGCLATIYTGTASASKALAAVSSTPEAYPEAIFGRLSSNNATDGTAMCKMRLYDLKVYEDNELVHHYVPCIRDGLAGVYDTESGDFFTDSRYRWLMAATSCSLPTKMTMPTSRRRMAA